MHSAFATIVPSVVSLLTDDHGYSVEVGAERELAPDEVADFAFPALVLARPTLSREPSEVRGLVSIEDDELWVSVSITAPGPFDDQARASAGTWFGELWDAVHAGARDGAGHLDSEAQLLELARASRETSWVEAILRAGRTASGPACPR